jgi:hypothetical protein
MGTDMSIEDSLEKLVVEKNGSQPVKNQCVIRILSHSETALIPLPEYD